MFLLSKVFYLEKHDCDCFLPIEKNYPVCESYLVMLINYLIIQEIIRVGKENQTEKWQRIRNNWSTYALIGCASQARGQGKQTNIYPWWCLKNDNFLTWIYHTRASISRCFNSKKDLFLDFSGVFWRQLNCSNLFPESSLLRKNLQY